MAKKKSRIMDTIKEWFSYITQIVSETIFPTIEQGAEKIMDNIEQRLLHIEKRVWKKVYSLLIIGVGLLFLVFSLFFYLKEYLAWNNTMAFFSIGIVIFIMGLLLKLRDQNL